MQSAGSEQARVFRMAPGVRLVHEGVPAALEEADAEVQRPAREEAAGDAHEPEHARADRELDAELVVRHLSEF